MSRGTPAASAVSVTLEVWGSASQCLRPQEELPGTEELMQGLEASMTSLLKLKNNTVVDCLILRSLIEHEVVQVREKSVMFRCVLGPIINANMQEV